MTPQLKAEIFAHLHLREGKRNVVYKDSLGKPTVGVGHLVLPQDNLRVGDKISDDQVNKLLEMDAAWAIDAAYEQADEMGCVADEVIIALVSVNYQLGKHWRTEWKNTWAHIAGGRYQNAINAIAGSRWAQQTPVRTKDFIEVLAKLRDGGISFDAANHEYEKETPIMNTTPEEPINAAQPATVTQKGAGGLVAAATALQDFLNSQFMMQFAGKKTYLMAIIIKVNAILGLWLGDLSWNEALAQIGIGGGFATVKHSQQRIDAENDKEKA